MNDFEAKSSRSINVEDLEVLKAFAHNIEALEKISSGYVCDGSITVCNSGGYIVGEIWWNPDSEIWAVDTARYGESA